MRAEMTGDGIITLFPENQLEAYALKHWKEMSTISINDLQRMEKHYWLGSRLKIGHTIPKEQA
jgi:hypothetical protein